MLSFIIKRLLLAIPMIIGTSLFVFTLFELSDVDPARRYLGERSQDESAVQALREEWGLNRPAHVRYLEFIKGVFTGNFGKSIRTGRPVSVEIREFFPATLELGFAALLLTLLIGFSAGTVAGLKRNTIFDYTAMGGAILAVSLPVFWLALLLVYFLGDKLQWFPTDRRLSLKFTGAFESRTGLVIFDAAMAGRWDAVRDAFWHLCLPAITLAMVSAALVARMMRSSVLEVLRQDFVRTAQAKGLGRLQWLHHVMRNALIPTVTIVGIEIPALLGGAVITERIYTWPGMGTFLIDSILYADVTAVQGIIMFLTVLFIFVNLVVDLMYGVIDPRIRVAGT